MQISGANLLIAAQQQSQTPPRATQHSSFAAMTKSGAVTEAEFSPLSFGAAEPPQKAVQPGTVPAAMTEPKPTQKLGSTLDIRV
jgi:hypothetical protein